MPPVVPPPSPDAGPAAPAGPAAAPMSNPTEKAGLKAQAMARIQLAITILEPAVMAFGTQDPIGKKILSAVNNLGNIAGKAKEGGDMNQSTMKMLAAEAGPEGMPAGGGGPKPPAPGGPGGMPMLGPSPMGI